MLTKYIVRCYQPQSDLWLVKIYNRDWNRISAIDGYAEALTVTPSVNDNRIHEYSQDGTLIRELLDKYKFKGTHTVSIQIEIHVRPGTKE